jgi:hypothetical protein
LALAPRGFLIAIERRPSILENIEMIDVKRPIELAGMRA